MTVTIDYKPWAIGGSANVDTQSEFLAEAALATGFAAGLAKSKLVNKVIRQSSVVAAAVATFISNQLAADVLDDGDVPALVTALGSAISSVAAAAGFPSGTKMLFVQTAAPTGWTKVTTHNDKALRVVSGSASSGGSIDFSTAFTSQSVSGTNDAFILGIGDIPAHHHFEFNTDSVSSSGTTLNGSNFATWQRSSGASSNDYSIQGDGTTPTIGLSSDTGGGGGHTHNFTGNTINLTVKYVDVIIASKN